MGGNIMLIFIGFIVLLKSQWTTAACVCKSQLSPHIQNYVCQNDFVLRGFVKRLVSTEEDRKGIKMRTFQVKVRRVFKGRKDTPRAVLIKIPEKTEDCGRALSPTSIYLLAGKIKNGEFYLDACTSWIEPWYLVHRHQMKFLNKGKYEDNCACRVNSCKNKKRCRLTCDYDKVKSLSPDVQGCYAESAYCKKIRKAKCAWIGTKTFRQCTFTGPPY